MGFLEALRPYWHPVTRSEAVQDGPVSITLLDEQLVLFRSGGEIVAFDSLYIMTRQDGRWGIKGRSSFAPSLRSGAFRPWRPSSRSPRRRG